MSRNAKKGSELTVGIRICNPCVGISLRNPFAPVHVDGEEGPEDLAVLHQQVAEPRERLQQQGHHHR